MRILGTPAPSLTVEAERKRTADGDAGTRAADDLQATAHALDPFAHLPQPEMPGLGADRFGAAGGQAHAVVRHFDGRLVALDADVGGGAPRVGVPGAVRPRFLARCLALVAGRRRQTGRVRSAPERA